jgi:sulfite reductase alpha subunit-like flavoprotein
MLMPEGETFDADLIMVATGTGIAPYRSMIRRLFVEKTPAAEAYKGQAWLFLGVANSDALLYDDEWQVRQYALLLYSVALCRGRGDCDMCCAACNTAHELMPPDATPH